VVAVGAEASAAVLGLLEALVVVEGLA